MRFSLPCVNRRRVIWVTDKIAAASHFPVDGGIARDYGTTSTGDHR